MTNSEVFLDLRPDFDKVFSNVDQWLRWRDSYVQSFGFIIELNNNMIQEFGFTALNDIRSNLITLKNCGTNAQGRDVHEITVRLLNLELEPGSSELTTIQGWNVGERELFCMMVIQSYVSSATAIDVERNANDDIRKDLLEGLICGVSLKSSRAQRYYREIKRTLPAEVENAKQELESIQELYRKEMSFKAPVRYFRLNSRVHRRRANLYLNFAVSIGTLIGIAAFTIVGLLLHEVRTVFKDEWQKLWLLTVIGFTTITVSIWVIRTMLRLFLAETHLHTDMEIRSVMTEAYCAMNNDKIVGQEDRIHVLQSIFRPISDGVVRDDAAMDPSVFADVLRRTRG